MIGVHTYPFKEEHSIPGTCIPLRTLTRVRPLLLCASPINAGSEKDSFLPRTFTVEQLMVFIKFGFRHHAKKN